ncbi:hypothetical protein PMIN06_004854 [Paraphaeosphaeria minitans]
MSASDGRPPSADTNYAPTFLVVTGVFTLLATGLCSARICTRLRPKPNLRIDDYLISIATILCIVDFFLSLTASLHGWGHHSAYVTPPDVTMVMKVNFVQQVVWIAAIALTRLSIALSLLRLSHDRYWRLTLWSIIAVQMVTYAGHMLFQFANCTPLRASWEPVYDVRCWPRKYVLVFGWVANSLLVLNDAILALLPIHLIRTLHRSPREKVLICILMGTGLLAAAIAAYRMGLSNATFAGDLLSSTVMMSMWCMLEVLLGIIAACLAPLKAPVERALNRAGLLVRRGQATRPSFVVSLGERDLEGGREEVPPSRSTDGEGCKDSVHEGVGKRERERAGVATVEARRGDGDAV